MIKKCKYCDLDFSNYTPSQKGGHTRFCKNNPEYENNIKEHKNRNKNQTPWNKGMKSPYSEETNLKRGKTVSQKHKQGIYKDSAKKSAKTRKINGNHLHTEETKQRIRDAALVSPHRRLKKGVIEYKGILLDSSWELELAKRLDELEIKWIRPDPIPWVDDEGVTHNYFPDFYLEDYDLFLDPKNPQAIKVQKKKIDCLLTQYKNIVIIDSIEKCKQYSV